ncbi:sugar ABC transporter ATP-binding protein [Thermotoga caldifontis]|uniref:sugar ABC transporter ATP-binding protein n=1 Tax=Thermotoga caldifontis TaxID=1508419 RepID=UPI00059708C7|nr:sugar ABC transporter ATP-binding protein [Thermotoga caldifontis]
MSSALVRVEHISKRFGGIQALNDVSFDVNHGEVIGLIGENGSGKSTMIKILTGVYKPDSGDIYIDGRRYKSLEPIQAIREGIHVIHQDFSLFPNLTVAENIALSSLIHESKKIINWRDIYKIAEENLRKINPSIPLDVELGALSASERQVVAIARTLVHGARFIIMDEPTTALTRKEVEALFEIIRRLKQEGISVLFVSHKLYEIKEIADRVIVFRDGRKVFDEPINNVDIRTMEYYMTGRKLDELEVPKLNVGKGKTLLSVRNLSLPPYFLNVSFDLAEGEVLGITGLIGSGQRELVLSLFGFIRPQSGKIYIGGQEVSIKTIQDAVNLGVGYVPEDRINEGLFMGHPITLNICSTIIDSIRSRIGFIKYRKMKNIANSYVLDLKIRTPSVEVPVETLSGGNQQRVVIARWLVKQPRILILNGPTVGIDVGSKLDIHILIRTLADKQRMGIIIVSDDIPELLRVCDRILLMKRGRLAAQYQRDEISEDELYGQMIKEESPTGGSAQ